MTIHIYTHIAHTIYKHMHTLNTPYIYIYIYTWYTHTYTLHANYHTTHTNQHTAHTIHMHTFYTHTHTPHLSWPALVHKRIVLTIQNVPRLVGFSQNVQSGKWGYFLSRVTNNYWRKKIFNYKLQWFATSQCLRYCTHSYRLYVTFKMICHEELV